MTHSYNQKLIEQQKLNDKDILNLDKLYKELDTLLTNSFYDTEESASNTIKELTMLEFKLQDTWKFPLNQDYHKYHLQLPLCTCPKIDNKERLGIGTMIVTKGCMYHSKKYNTKDNNENSTNTE